MKKNILIIGIYSNIGYDLAILLLRKKHNVYCGVHRTEKPKKLRKMGAYVHKVDVFSEQEITNIIESMIMNLGHIDIIYTNVYRAEELARSVMPHMRHQQFGRLIFTTSVANKITKSIQKIEDSNIQIVTIDTSHTQAEFDKVQPIKIRKTHPSNTLNDTINILISAGLSSSMKLRSQYTLDANLMAWAQYILGKNYMNNLSVYRIR
ncbi:SDR family NAD(P)-dependent oxidoreductase [Aliivibrio sifiae]|uniref:NAD(P)-binding domain-containing protein n=1 Tax=Aliivibrio sifiae TaxID=566293 RepID=A0A2S7XK25_9GAMM|nr:SDR family NAD(P)-dependent oxidoreductase [Aliivibrio sifiae]PQJ93828.1 hypothetical protein BTO23_07000 [Aliivibrio sifiae]GLR75264.1 hypothetical protein GCM10007855_21380 [Aliivibrio sifiae]